MRRAYKTINLNRWVAWRCWFVCMLLSLLFAPAAVAADTVADDPAGDLESVDLYFFWSRYCPHCQQAQPFVRSLAAKYPWLVLHSYDLVDQPEHQRLYMTMAEQMQQPANSVPAFIFCGRMLVGYHDQATTGRELEENLLACHQGSAAAADQPQETFTVPGVGALHYDELSLPVFTLLIAALDAFNPCAFFVLFFLLSLMVHHRSQLRMLVVGMTFVLCSGLLYFLFMTAWLNVFLLTGQLSVITVIAGLIAVVFGLVNIKDYFWFKQGVSLSLSDSSRAKLFARIRELTQSGHWLTMIGATVILAVAANSYELLCTAGLPMIYTRMLTLHQLSSGAYYGYLAFYNAIYILPLMLIVVLFTVTLGRKKLSEREGRLLKLLSGSMMLGLGAILLLHPAWLNNLWISVGVITGALALSGLIAAIESKRSSG